MQDKYQRMWARAWCMYMWDALKGPMQSKPHDLEFMPEYESRLVARDHVIDLHPDFVECCENAGMGDPEAISEAFMLGKLTAHHIDLIWRRNGPND